jgi:hypothetical protein
MNDKGYSKILTKKFLEREYIKNKKSIIYIAKKMATSSTLVYYYFKKYKIKIRSRSKALEIRLKNPKNVPAYIDGRTLKKHYCPDCLNEGIKKIINYRSKHCSRHSQIGKLNNNWNFGSSFLPYSPKWSKKLKESIRERNNYECQNCGMTEKEHLVIYGETLHIHHIDYDKWNCKKNNLITLCCKCNSRANYNRDYWYAYFTYIIENG